MAVVQGMVFSDDLYQTRYLVMSHFPRQWLVSLDNKKTLQWNEVVICYHFLLSRLSLNKRFQSKLSASFSSLDITEHNFGFWGLSGLQDSSPSFSSESFLISNLFFTKSGAGSGRIFEFKNDVLISISCKSCLSGLCVLVHFLFLYHHSEGHLSLMMLSSLLS